MSQMWHLIPSSGCEHKFFSLHTDDVIKIAGASGEKKTLTLQEEKRKHLLLLIRTILHRLLRIHIEVNGHQEDHTNYGEGHTEVYARALRAQVSLQRPDEYHTQNTQTKYYHSKNS